MNEKNKKATKMTQAEQMLVKRYKRVIDAGTAALERALAEHLKLVPVEKQNEVVTIEDHPLNFELKEGGRAFHDVRNIVYCMYGKPFLRYRFRLRGTVFDYVIEEVDYDQKRSKAGPVEGDTDSLSGLVGSDGRPLPRSK